MFLREKKKKHISNPKRENKERTRNSNPASVSGMHSGDRNTTCQYLDLRNILDHINECDPYVRAMGSHCEM